FEEQAPDLATPETIAALEAKLSLRLPQTFVQFCMRWNGGFTSEESEFYPVPGQYKEFYEEFGSDDGGVLIHTLFGATDKFGQCDIREEYRLLNEETNWRIIPIGVNLFGDRAVLRSESLEGLVYWWDHELWETPEVHGASGNLGETPRLIPIAPNLES